MREIFQRFSGSTRSKKQMEQPKASSSTPNHKPHFFKFLFPDPFANLCIPKKFYKHLPAVPPKQASLVTTQTDNFWRVDVCQNEEGICFSRGWPEFAEAHHLQIGYLVVFRYEGKMVFNVQVFDTTSCIKDYSLTPCKPPNFEFGSSKFVDLTSDVQVKSEGETQIPVASGRKRNSATGKAQLVGEEDWEEGKPIIKKKKLSQKISLQDYSSTPCKPPNFKFDSSKFVDLISDVQVKSEGEIQIPVASGRKRNNATGKAQAVVEEDSSEEEKPIIKNRVQKKLTPKSSSKMSTVPQFVKTLGCTSTTKHRRLLYIPKRFCVENGLVSERTMFLKNSMGKKWRVKFTIRKLLNVGMLTVGWRVFSTENGLRKGDECIFKLIDKKTFLVDVV